jgi:histone H3/H4
MPVQWLFVKSIAIKKQLNDLINQETRGVLKVFSMEHVFRDALANTGHAKSKTVTAMVVAH